jgi:hypothetical protein
LAEHPPKNTIVPTSGETPDEKEPKGHSPDDLEALDDFCSSIELEDISFDAFCESNNCLHVRIRVLVSEQEFTGGGKRKVDFTRTVKVSTPKGVKVTKEKVSYEVTWKNGTCVGDVICVEKIGDKDQDGEIGHLYVTLEAS